MEIVFSYEVRLYFDKETAHTGGFVIADSYASAAAQLEEVYTSELEAITRLEAVAPGNEKNVFSCYDIYADKDALEETEIFDRLVEHLKENAIW